MESQSRDDFNVANLLSIFWDEAQCIHTQRKRFFSQTITFLGNLQIFGSDCQGYNSRNEKRTQTPGNLYFQFTQENLLILIRSTLFIFNDWGHVGHFLSISQWSSNPTSLNDWSQRSSQDKLWFVYFDCHSIKKWFLERVQEADWYCAPCPFMNKEARKNIGSTTMLLPTYKLLCKELWNYSSISSNRLE